MNKNQKDVLNVLETENFKREIERANKRKISSTSAVEIERLNPTENVG